MREKTLGGSPPDVDVRILLKQILRVYGIK
jgi:hypothetical protein